MVVPKGKSAMAGRQAGSQGTVVVFLCVSENPFV